jgi:hypothetical protein
MPIIPPILPPPPPFFDPCLTSRTEFECPFPRERLALMVPSLGELTEVTDAALGMFRAVIATSKGARAGRVSAELAERMRAAGTTLVLHATSVEEAEEVAAGYNKLSWIFFFFFFF